MPTQSRYKAAMSSREHYLRNKAAYKKKAYEHCKKARLRNRRFVYQYLAAHPCVDCGESNVLVLEFDHVRGTKKNDVAHMVHGSHSLETLRREIAKCEVRCANCHRIATAKRSGLDKRIEEVLVQPKDTLF